MLSIKDENNQKKKVALIGCGLIGQSWAISFLSAGFDVSLFDPVKGVTKKAKEKIKAKLSVLQNYGLLKIKIFLIIWIEFTLPKIFYMP